MVNEQGVICNGCCFTISACNHTPTLAQAGTRSSEPSALWPTSMSDAVAAASVLLCCRSCPHCCTLLSTPAKGDWEPPLSQGCCPQQVQAHPPRPWFRISGQMVEAIPKPLSGLLCGLQAGEGLLQQPVCNWVRLGTAPTWAPSSDPNFYFLSRPLGSVPAER